MIFHIIDLISICLNLMISLYCLTIHNLFTNCVHIVDRWIFINFTNLICILIHPHMIYMGFYVLYILLPMASHTPSSSILTNLSFIFALFLSFYPYFCWNRLMILSNPFWLQHFSYYFTIYYRILFPRPAYSF